MQEKLRFNLKILIGTNFLRRKSFNNFDLKNDWLTLFLINLRQGKCSIIKAHCGSIRSLTYSSDGAYLLSSSDDKTSKLWRVQDKKFMFSLASHKNWVRSGVISPDMRIIASGSDDKTVKLWDFNSQELLNTFNDH